MKNTPAALLSHMAQDTTTIAGCWKLQRTDGTVMGFTDHDADLVIDAITYQAASGFRRTASRQNAGVAPDNMELVGLLDNAIITETDIIAGRYRGAQAWYFEVNWADLSQGKHLLDYGYIGKVTRKRGAFLAEFLSLANKLDQEIGNKYQRTCRATLGDSDCQVVLDPTAWQASEAVVVGNRRKATVYDGRRYACTTAGTTGTTEPVWDTTIGNTTADGTAVWTCEEGFYKQGSVTAASDRQTFVDTARTEADSWFRFGVLTWTGGANSGLAMDVKSSGADGSMVLKFAMPFDIANGDTYTVTAGCNHQLKMPGDTWKQPYTGDCRAKFGNARRFRGEPDIPGNDQVLAGP